MCGIYGWQLDDGALDFETRFVLACALAQNNDLRGGHSWGYAADGEIFKGLGRAIRSNGGADCDVMALAGTLVGHSRFATTGATTVKNQHPFIEGNVIGAHNGVVYNHEYLNKHYQRKMRVDSQHIFRHISEGRKLDDVRAYGAVEYWMKGHPHTISLGRFNDGQLCAAVLPWGVVWSSTSSHLWDALEQAEIADEAMTYQLRENVLYLVRGGRIRPKSTLEVGSREMIAPVSRVTVLPPSGQTKRVIRDLRLPVDDSPYANYVQHTVSKRGALLFPTKPKEA